MKNGYVFLIILLILVGLLFGVIEYKYSLDIPKTNKEREALNYEKCRPADVLC